MCVSHASFGGFASNWFRLYLNKHKMKKMYCERASFKRPFSFMWDSPGNYFGALAVSNLSQ